MYISIHNSQLTIFLNDSHCKKHLIIIQPASINFRHYVLIRRYSGDTTQDGGHQLNRSISRSEPRKKNVDEFDDDLPLPPE